MNAPSIRQQLVDLFNATAEAHHTAFLATKGVDPDWSIWYADNMKEPLAEQIHLDLYKSQLIYCLMDADFEHQLRAPASNWAEYYSDDFLKRYAASETPIEDKLALYHFVGCPFCAYVTGAMDKLGIDVELRDVAKPEYRDELVAERGRATVPVLRITSPDGEERWMPESRDIVSYLNETYG